MKKETISIKEVIHRKEIIEKKIFTMIKKFSDENNLVITGVEFWSTEDSSELKNVTLITEIKSDVDRNLIKMNMGKYEVEE